MTEREQLEQAIATMEAQRAILGDAVVDAMISAAREKLDALGKAAQAVPQRKQVTVLFADVSGFTAMSETMDAEDVSAVMNALWQQLDKAIASHGGTIDKHMGDAVMALWGVEIAREDDPERAIQAALAMQREVSVFGPQISDLVAELGIHNLKPKIEMRIGVNTGPVLLGKVGTTGEYTAIGDAVNTASRLERAAPVGGILISHDTYRHVRGFFDVQSLEPIQVKGKAELIQVYVVQRARPRAFRKGTRGVEGIETRMIGREAELKRLQDALCTSVGDSECQLVTIVGEAGVGKSRLLHEFENWVRLLPERVLHFRARASQRASNMPYFLIRELFASRFGIRSSDSAREARNKLEQGILHLMGADVAGERARMQAHFIGHLIGLDFSQSPYLQGILSDARQIRNRAFHYITQFFAAATSLPEEGGGMEDFVERGRGTWEGGWAEGETKKRAVLILLDDLHWADSGSLDLIEHLARECRRLPLLIVVLTRPEFFERRKPWIEEQAHRTRMKLRPLSEQDNHHLVEEILRRVEQVPPGLRDMIVSRAEGNPFYTEEVIKILIEDGVIVKGDDRWCVEPERLAQVRVPPTLIGVLQARLDGLPSLERKTLQRAAVAGRTFWDGAVEQLKGEAGAQENETDKALAALQSRELIFERRASAFEGVREYIFKHVILYDVTYESVLKRLRPAYHAQMAVWLVAQSGERKAEYAGLIGEHYERAAKRARAAEWYARAGRRAQDTYVPDVGIGYYQKALALLSSETLKVYDPHVVQRLELYQRLGLMLWWQAQFKEAAQAYVAMRTMAEAAGDMIAQVRAWEGLSSVQRAQGDYYAALESAGRAEEIARSAGPPAQEALARVLYNKGRILSDLGKAEEALSLGEQALVLGTELGAQRVIADNLNLLGWVHGTLGHYEQATRDFEQALALFRELGDRLLVCGTLNNLSAIAMSHEDYQKAAALYQEALIIAREIGQRLAEIVFLHNLGGARVGMGEHQAAEADLRQVIQMAEAAGWGGLSATYSFLAQACLGQGRVTEALAVARQALELAQETDSQEDLGEAWCALGMTLAAASAPQSVTIGDHTLDAVGCFARSLQVFAEIGMEAEQARTLRAWGRYEIERGDRERGEKMRQEAREIFARLGIET